MSHEDDLANKGLWAPAPGMIKPPWTARGHAQIAQNSPDEQHARAMPDVRRRRNGPYCGLFELAACNMPLAATAIERRHVRKTRTDRKNLSKRRTVLRANKRQRGLCRTSPPTVLGLSGIRTAYRSLQPRRFHDRQSTDRLSRIRCLEGRRHRCMAQAQYCARQPVFRVRHL